MPPVGGVGGGGNDPLKFYLLFDIKDESGDKLKQIAAGLKGLGDASEESGRRTRDGAGHVTDMVHAFREVEHLGHGVARVGEGVLETFAEMGHAVFETSSEFERLRATMGFAFGADLERAFANLKTFEQNSAFPMSELTEGVAALRSAFRGIDPTDLTPRFRNAVGQMSGSLEVLSDTAMGSQQNLRSVILEVERALEGRFTSIQRMSRLSVSEVEKMKHGIAAARTEQEKYDAIIQVLAGHWGGAQAALANTTGFILRNIASTWEQLLAAFGEEGLGPIKEGLRSLHTWMREALADPEFLRSVGSVFRMFGEAVGWALRQTVALARALQRFAKENPGLLRVGAAIVALGAAVAVVVGTLVAGAAALALAFTALQAVATPVLVAILAIGPAVVGLVAVGAMLKAAWEEHFGGITRFVNKVVLVVGALQEAFENWSDEASSISLETAAKLNEAGILGFFIDLVSWIATAKKFGQGLWEGLKDGYNQVKPSLKGLWDQLVAVKDAFVQLLVKMGLIKEQGNTTFKDAHDKGKAFGEFINAVLVPALKGVIWVLTATAWVLANVLIPGIGWLKDRWDELKNSWETNAYGIRDAVILLGGIIGAYLIKSIVALATTISTSLIPALVRAIPVLWAASVPLLEAVAVIAAIGVALWAMQQAMVAIMEVWNTGFGETWRLLTRVEAPDLDRLRATERGVPGAPAATAQPAPTAAPTVPATPETRASGPGGVGGAQLGAGMPWLGAEGQAVLNGILAQAQAQVAEQRRQNDLIANGGIVVNIDGEAVAGAVGRANASSGERMGQMGRR